jgi:AraC-like DNA-binding protein
MTTTDAANVVTVSATSVSEPTVLAAWTATVLQALDARGIDGMAVACAAGIDVGVFDVDGARIPLAQTTELWRRAIHATGDECFGLEVSRFVRPTTFQGLSMGIIASGTFRDALDRIVRFGPIVLSDGMIQNDLVECDGRCVYTSRTAPAVARPSDASREAILATIVRTARFLAGSDVSPSEVWLERPEAPPASRFERFFRCPVRYASDHYRMVFEADVVNRPLRTGSDDLARTADRLATDYLERVRVAGPVADRVRAVLAGFPTGEDVSADVVSSRLAMSSRTMQRHLQHEGTTFRDVVADDRICRAKRLIATEGLGALQLAHRLGFSDPAAFRRAFKRRTGMTAGQFAAQLRGPA